MKSEVDQEKERNRFARDLHDGFGQMISLLNLHLKTLEDRSTGGLNKRNEVFEKCSQVISN